MGPDEKEKTCRSLRTLRASFLLLLLKASFHRTEKIKPVAFSGQAFFCRGDVTRTHDPYVPNVVRYQLRYTPYQQPYPPAGGQGSLKIWFAKITIFL
jgi:hypothetical protein